MNEPNASSADAIAIVGNINLDIRTSILPATAELFEDGETSAGEIYESVGGGGANIASAAARLGGRVHFCGCVGCDGLGERLEACLCSLGISTHLRRKGGPTGRSINLVWDNGHRHFVSNLPNSRQLSIEDFDLSELFKAGCRQLFRADVWFSEAMLESGNRELLSRAQALGMETSMDVNWDPEWNHGPDSAKALGRRSQVRGVLPYVTWVHGNERELNLFLGRQDIGESCRMLLDYGCNGVIVHRGELGAASFTAERGWVGVAAAPVRSIVCETGTGDVFSAAFLVHRPLPLVERLVRCCGISAQYLQGSLDLIPRLTEVASIFNPR